MHRAWPSHVFLAAMVVMAWSQSAIADLPETIRRIKPSIVAVGTFQPTRSPAFKFYGTGFAVGDGLTVATNAHVVPTALAVEELESLAVVSPKGDQFEVRGARQTRVDIDHDVALLHIDRRPLPVLQLAETMAEDGDEVAFTGFPIGSALGLRPVTHRGIISATTPISIPRGNARELDARQIHRLATSAFDVYQLDATAYPGNSGSPLYDQKSGRVVGILNMVFVKETKENVLSKPSGISYAIPAKHLAKLLEGK